MKKIFKFIVVYLVIIGLAIITTTIGKNIYGLFFPRQLMAGWGTFFTPGIIEGFVFMYLFWLSTVFVPVFKQKWWQYALAPGLIVWLPVALFWPVGLVGVIFCGVGVGLGYLALWLKRKIS